jgi:exodeoxyribonuclease V gamma subunit
VLTYDKSFVKVKNFYDRFSCLLVNRENSIKIDLDINGFNLTGTADNIYNGRSIFFRYATAKGMDILSAWITHLALCAGGEFSGETYLISKNITQGWGQVAGCREILASLLEIYEEGMMKPLPLFPKSSLRFAEVFHDGKKGEPGARALKAAAGAFSSSYYRGDSDDQYIRKFFSDIYLCRDKFQELALKVYAPVYENMLEEAEL